MPPLIRGLRQARRLNDLTQTQLAQEAGVSRQVILDLEHNGTTPRLALARKLAKILDVPIDVLFPPSGDNGAAA